MREVLIQESIVKFSKLEGTFVIPIYNFFQTFCIYFCAYFNALDAFCGLKWVKTGSIPSYLINYLPLVKNVLSKKTFLFARKDLY